MVWALFFGGDPENTAFLVTGLLCGSLLFSPVLRAMVRHWQPGEGMKRH
jgi:hypothetical protein